MTSEELMNSLLKVPKFEPRAVQLLREQRQRTGELYPRIESVAEKQRMWREMDLLRENSGLLFEKLQKLRPIAVVSGRDEIQRIFL